MAKYFILGIICIFLVYSCAGLNVRTESIRNYQTQDSTAADTTIGYTWDDYADVAFIAIILGAAVICIIIGADRESKSDKEEKSKPGGKP